MAWLESFLHDQRGTAAIQHALVAAVVCLAVLTSGLALREPIIDLYNGIGSEVGDALTHGAPSEQDGET